MLLSPYLSRHSFAVDNYSMNPSVAPGTSVTPGASNAEGTYTQLLTALAQDVYGFYLQVNAGATAAAAKPRCLT